MGRDWTKHSLLAILTMPACTCSQQHAWSQRWGSQQSLMTVCENICVHARRTCVTECMLTQACASLPVSECLKCLHVGMWLRFRLPHLPKPKQCLPNKDTLHSPHRSLPVSLCLSLRTPSFFHSSSSSIHSSSVSPYLDTFFSLGLVVSGQRTCEKFLPGFISHTRPELPLSDPRGSRLSFRPPGIEVSVTLLAEAW